MQKKPQSFMRTIEGTYFRRSDLRTLVELWTPKGEGDKLKIETNLHVFDSIDELLESKEPADRIVLSQERKPYKYSQVTIRPGETGVHIGDADYADLGLGGELEALLLKCRRPFRLTERGGFILFAIGMLASGLVGVSKDAEWSKYHPGLLQALILVSVLILVAALAGFGSYLLRPKIITFRPERGESKPINWRGAMWQVFTILLSGLVGGFVGKALTKCPQCPPPTMQSGPNSR